MIQATHGDERARTAELLRRLERTNEALRRTQDVADALARTRTVAEVAEVALAQGLAAMNAEAGTVYLYDDEQEILRLTRAVGYAEPMLRGFERIAHDSNTPLAVAMRTREPLFAQHSPPSPAHSVEAPPRAATAVAAVPLVVHGRALGVIGLSFDSARSFPDDERAFLLGIARQCAQALDRARLFEAERRGREIAERMRAEAEAAERRSRDADHRKDQFLAMLGHELRNPLAPILTALELMRMKGARDFLRERTIIERQVEHVVRLVDDLLDVSRVTRGKLVLRRELVNVAEAVSKAIEMTSPLLEQRAHRLDIDIGDDPLWVKGDLARLSQVVANLLNNAAKYTESGGHIKLCARREGDHIVIRLRDHGIGISADALPNIFDSFVQEARSVHRAQGGLGLGLTIVRSLVELHGGTVTAQSDGARRGSLFVVRLPAAGIAGSTDLPFISSEGRPVRAEHTALRPQRVLIVDDNPDAAATLADALAAAGHETRVADDGPTALRIAETFKPEVAVLDLGLPVMDGIELAGRLKASATGAVAVRCIAVTGYGQENDLRRSRDAGFDAHFVKPVNLERLLEAVDLTEDDL